MKDNTRFVQFYSLDNDGNMADVPWGMAEIRDDESVTFWHAVGYGMLHWDRANKVTTLHQLHVIEGKVDDYIENVITEDEYKEETAPRFRFA